MQRVQHSLKQKNGRKYTKINSKAYELSLPHAYMQFVIVYSTSDPQLARLITAAPPLLHVPAAASITPE